MQSTVFKHCLVQFINFLVLGSIVEWVYFAVRAKFLGLIGVAFGVSGGLQVERVMVVLVLEVADLILVAGVEKIEGVEDETFLDNHVQGRICGETRTVVDLQEQGLEVLLDQDIKT